MLVNFIEMLNNAKKERCAIPHLNINNLEWSKIILEKCQELNVPVILGVSASAAEYFGGWYVCYSVVSSLIKSLNITIPVCLHVDHGTKEECIEAINSGFTSVMIDASKYKIEENIKITKEVVDYAHQRNVSVEAEIGTIGLAENKENNWADINECIRLCEETNIDAIAPAIGNAHGIYIETPKLNFKLLKEINDKIKIPLVLHGGSGITNDEMKELIQNGISKVNINTDLQLVWKKGVMKYIENNKDVYDPRKIIYSGKKEMNKKIEELVDLFETKKVSNL